VRGLWYFFGIVIAAGIFAGVAGLGLGYVGGLLWEQFHRHRRNARVMAKANADAAQPPTIATIREDEAVAPRLQLVSIDLPVIPDLAGKTLTSVRFLARSIQLDLSGNRIELTGNPLVVCGLQRTRYPDPGSRDALCSLIGDQVQEVRAASSERIEMRFYSGCELVIQRNAVAVA
jgi:hypothetical protein